jgi:hypothetical protein
VAVYNDHFGPRRRNAFSPGSTAEPGLKARTKASLSTGVHTVVHDADEHLQAEDEEIPLQTWSPPAA